MTDHARKEGALHHALVAARVRYERDRADILAAGEYIQILEAHSALLHEKCERAWAAGVEEGRLRASDHYVKKNFQEWELGDQAE